MMHGLTALVAVCLLGGSFPPHEQTRELTASSDDGRTLLTLQATHEYRDTIAPGETVMVKLRLTSIAESTQQFPSNYVYLPQELYLQTPSGEVLQYTGWQSAGDDPRYGSQPLLRPKRSGLGLRECYIDMVGPSSHWIDPESKQPVKANLRAEGNYKLWATYTIASSLDTPRDAWAGKLETSKIQFTVKEVPIADRLSTPTAEQLAHLEAFMKYRMALSKREAIDRALPDAVEMPKRLSLIERLQWAFRKTENEGIARHAMTLLRQHQARGDGQQYPEWWSSLHGFVYMRTVADDGNWRINDPFLSEFIAVSATELEREMAGKVNTGYVPVGLFSNYAKRVPKGVIGQRLLATAKRNAPHALLDPNGHRPEIQFLNPGDDAEQSRLTACWSVLFNLGGLPDNLSLSEAVAILGPPTSRRNDEVEWWFGWPKIIPPPRIRGKLSTIDGIQTIIFANRDEWEFGGLR